MANIIIKNEQTRQRNACMEAQERAMSRPKKYNTTSTHGDLTIKENHTASGHKMHVVTDKDEKADKNAKAKFLRNLYGDNPTKNGHGTVVTMGDADK